MKLCLSGTKNIKNNQKVVGIVLPTKPGGGENHQKTKTKLQLLADSAEKHWTFCFYVESVEEWSVLSNFIYAGTAEAPPRERLFGPSGRRRQEFFARAFGKKS